MTTTLVQILLFQAPRTDSGGGDWLWWVAVGVVLLGLLLLTRQKHDTAPAPEKKEPQNEADNHQSPINTSIVEPEKNKPQNSPQAADQTTPVSPPVSIITREDLNKSLAHWTTMLMKDIKKHESDLLRQMSTKQQDWGMFLNAVRQSAEISNLRDGRRDPSFLSDLNGIVWMKSPALILVEGLCTDFCLTRPPARGSKIYEAVVKKVDSKDIADGDCLMLCFERSAEHDPMGYLSIDYDKTDKFNLKDIQGFERKLEVYLERPFNNSTSCDFIGNRDTARIIWVEPGLIRRNTVGGWEIIRPVVVEYL